MKGNEDNDYKGDAGGFRNEIREDLEEHLQKFNDPVVLGEIMYKLLEERENTNRILKNILTKLESLEVKGTIQEEDAQAIKEEAESIILPEIDEQILEFVQKNGKTTAEKVRVRFKYRGKNAASARLNKLVGLNLLAKKQVGKKVYFFSK